jgi:hypothetical protein
MTKAVGVDIPSDSFGQAIKSAVDRVRDDLEVRYGQPQALDLLTPGSIWNDPQDWLMGLVKGERSYAFFWERPANADPKVWRGVKSVSTYAGASGQQGWVSIEYDFDNGNRCDEALKRQAAKAL